MTAREHLAPKAVRRALYAGLVIAAGCNSPSGTVIIEPGPDHVIVTGAVRLASGGSATGARVHTRLFAPDCTAPTPSGGDTSVVTDSAGRFKGFIYVYPPTPPTPFPTTVCARSWATSPSGNSISDTASAQLKVGNGMRELPPDTARFQLTLP